MDVELNRVFGVMKSVTVLDNTPQFLPYEIVQSNARLTSHQIHSSNVYSNTTMSL